ncbi:MAG: DNA polymerase III subunit alpha, partial [Chloroflexota bacterium]
ERCLRPILGTEVTLEDGAHLLLLAEDRAGYGNLCWLLSRAQLGGSKGHARLPWERLRGRTAGLIALTGCAQGPVSRPLLAKERDRAAEALRTLASLFAPGCLYVELQCHLLRGDEPLMAELADLAATLALPLVATNNVHYATRDEHELQDVLVAIRHNVPLSAAQPWLRPNSEYALKSADEMRALFAAYPQAIANTLAIAARCQVKLDLRAEALPPHPHGDEGSADACLAALCQAQLPRAYPGDGEAARGQLAHELDVIRQTQLAGYFLMVWDVVRFAHERGIQIRGRGSAANSIVSYLLGITNVDPLRHNLLFERFLSAESRVMPDIDLDLCARRREEVIEYVYQKYGESHVGMVCNYVTYRQRSAVRDVGLALGFPPALLRQLGRRLRQLRGADIAEAADELNALPEGAQGALWPKLLALCAQIEGLPRHLSIHVGGLCITRAPLDELVPLERATMPGRVVVQWNKDGIEDAGLIKLDLLSLRTLAAVDECLALIAQTRGEHIVLDDLPPDDPAVYAALQQADTIGAFQVESRAQQQSLVQSRPACFEDIVVQVALIRPGPIQGNMVHPYLRRRQRLEPVQYLHPMLEPILRETLGVVVFQEQVIRIAMAMGRFSAGEADLLRRAMSRHRSAEEMARFRQRFIAGATAQGVDQTLAGEIFTKLSGFASYGFCKSHAAAFARTAYDTLYLRAHYPTAYYCAILNNQPMGFYAPRIVLGDARRHGVQVLPVEINRSQERCTVEDERLRIGFIYVDGLGEAAIARLLAARAGGDFANLEDLCQRTRLPRRSVENLILAGALDALCPTPRDAHRRQLLWHLGRLRYQEEELPLTLPSDGVALDPMTDGERLAAEYDATGLTLGGHPLELWREQLEDQGVCTSAELSGARPGERLRVAGLVAIRQMPATAKGFLFLTLEDEWGLMNIVVRPDIYRAQRLTWMAEQILVVEGLVERNAEQVTVLAQRAWGIGQLARPRAAPACGGRGELDGGISQKRPEGISPLVMLRPLWRRLVHSGSNRPVVIRSVACLDRST